MKAEQRHFAGVLAMKPPAPFSCEFSASGVSTCVRPGGQVTTSAPRGATVVTPDQAKLAGEMDRAAWVHGPFQRLGGNGPASSQGHSGSIGSRCEVELVASVVDVFLTSSLLVPGYAARGSHVRHADLRHLMWPKGGCVHRAQRGERA